MRIIRIRAIAFAAAIIMCCGALSFAAMAARPGGAEAVSGGAELSAEFGRTVTIRNKVIEGDVFSFDAQLYGADPEGFLTAALYEKSGRMADLKIFPAQESVRFSFAADGEPDCVKVVWTDKNFRPLTGALQVTVSSAYLVSEDGDTSGIEHVADSMLEYKGEVFEAEYIDNELILAAAEGAGREDIEKLLAPYGASIYDVIDSVGHYCVTLGEAQSGASLSSIADELRASALLDGVYFNTVNTLELCAEFAPDYPSDDWGIPDTAARWNEGYPFGYNWGVEAINLGSARRLLSDRHVTGSVSVGVIDSMFDAAHPDLSLKHVWVRSGGAFEVSTNRNALRDLADKNKSLIKSKGYVHGTHVAGTIAAPENGSGVTGVAAGYAELYCMGSRDDKGNAKFTVSEMEKALELLFKNASDKKIIINYSNVEKGKNGGCVKRTDVDTVTDYLKRKLSGGYDFLIAAAAGNADGRDPAEVSIFNAVTDAEVASRIIVVGGVARYQDDGDGKYKSGVYEDFALMDRSHFNYNYGGRIDVAAPGECVYSTVPPGQTTEYVLYDGKNNEYARMVGTSQATPHVTGTAALVWAANKTLTGDQVKRLILDTADVKLVNDDRIKMINAAAAVAGALKTDYVPGGKCGDSVYWKLDTTDNTLTISGSGAMYDYSAAAANVPWYRYLKTAKGIKVVIGDQVTGIGKYAFVHLKNGLRSVEFGTSLEKIGQSAFEECAFLSEVSKFPASLKEIGEKAFYNVAAKEFRFSSVSPEITVAERSSKSSSFYNGTAAGVTLYYPAAYKENWDPAGTGKWSGYSILPYGRTVRGNAVDSDTGEPVEGAMVTLSFGTGVGSEMVTKTDEKGAFEFSPEMEGALYVSLDIKHANYQLKATSGTLGKDDGVFEWKDVKMDRLYPVTLKVTDEKDRPVPGASVYISELGETVKTGSDGTCTFRAVNGTYLCRVSTGDGASADDRVTVNAGPAEHTVVLDTGIVSVTVTVTDPDGNAVSGVKILGTKLASDPATGSDGTASFEIKKGNYTFSVSTSSYYGSKDVSVTGDTQVALALSDSWMEWSYDEETGALTITGGGPMPDYKGSLDNGAPWAWTYDHGIKSITVNGLSEIGKNAFYKCGNAQYVSLADSVTSIKDYAFYGCSGVTQLYLPPKTEYIGMYAFSDCTALTGIEIPEGVTNIGSSAFNGCSALEEVTIPDSCRRFGDRVFAGCEKLKTAGPSGSGCNIEFAWSDTIPGNAFRESMITDVTIPEGFKSIMSRAFESCKYLSHVSIPESVVSFGYDDINTDYFVLGNYGSTGAFTGCDRLTSAGPSGSGCSLEFGWTREIPNGAFLGCESLENVTLPDGIEKIGDLAFKNCAALVRVETGPGIKEIGCGAFAYCGALAGFSIPGDTAVIGDCAFTGCGSLSGIVIPEKLGSIGADAFSGCGELNVTVLGTPVCKGAFSRKNETDTVSLVISDGVTSVGSYAFANCTAIVSVQMADSVETLESYAFSSCRNLASVRLSGTLKTMGDHAFYRCALTDAALPDSLKTIGGSAFSECPLTGIAIPDSVESVGMQAFSGCGSLAEADFGSAYAKIEYAAFSKCVSLEKVGFGNVVSIGSYAFSGCEKLTLPPLPESLLEIKDNAFKGCTSIDSVTICGSPMCTGAFKFGEISLKIAGGAAAVQDKAFRDCTAIVSLELADSVANIGGYAFYGCSSLKSVSFGSGLKTIGGGAFSQCAELTIIELPDSVESIGQSAFSYCKKLTAANIPEKLTVIERETFAGTGIKKIVIPDTVTKIGEMAFYQCVSLTSLKIGEGVTVIDGSAFSGCAGITGLTLPNSVAAIHSFAFHDCTGITELTVPENVISIFNGAFAGCTGIQKIVFKNTERLAYNMDPNVFENITATVYYPESWYVSPTESYGGELTWVSYDPAAGPGE